MLKGVEPGGVGRDKDRHKEDDFDDVCVGSVGEVRGKKRLGSEGERGSDGKKDRRHHFEAAASDGFCNAGVDEVEECVW